jgi:hypothetical protein
MGAKPVPGHVGGASFQDIDAPAGLGVDEDRRVDKALPQREVVDLSGARTGICLIFPGEDVDDGVRSVVRRC